jgi:hypothetical protein
LRRVASRAPTVEVVLLSAIGGHLRFRAVRQPLVDGVHPDDLARRISGLTACTPGAVLHSTSWRYADGRVVLTYAALPDPTPDPAGAAVTLDAMVTGAGPLTPSPSAVGLGAVAAHACRHLTLLAGTDDCVALAARELPDIWELVGKLAPASAGGLTSVALRA